MQPASDVSWLCYTGNDGVRPKQLHTGDGPYPRLKNVIHYTDRFDHILYTDDGSHPIQKSAIPYASRVHLIFYISDWSYPRLKSVIHYVSRVHYILYTGNMSHPRLLSVIHYASRAHHIWYAVTKECHPFCWQNPSYIAHWWSIVPKTKQCHPLCSQHPSYIVHWWWITRLKNVHYADSVHHILYDKKLHQWWRR